MANGRATRPTVTPATKSDEKDLRSYSRSASASLGVLPLFITSLLAPWPFALRNQSFSGVRRQSHLLRCTSRALFRRNGLDDQFAFSRGIERGAGLSRREFHHCSYRGFVQCPCVGKHDVASDGAVAF